jgi:hypothetical protein
MFEKLTRQAESVATGLSVSRRGFLGRAGRGAIATAGALGVLLAAPGKARAGNHQFVKCMHDCCANGFCNTPDGYSTCYFICNTPQ